MSPYLGMLLHVLMFAFWSSFWPRPAIKGRIEPKVGFMAYRLFYNAGTIFLFGATFLYLQHRSHETVQLWQVRHLPWFKPFLYVLEGLGVFFLSACVHLGLSFWGLRPPGPDQGLQTGGFYKITRHPLYWSVFCLLFGHMLVLGSGLAVLFFVAMEAYNILGVIMFENRGLARTYGEPFEAYKRRVSTVPFLSILRGRVRLSRGDISAARLAGTALFTATVGLLHGPVILPLFAHLPDLGQIFGARP